MTERLFTSIIKNRDGALLWLRNGLGGEDFRLAGEFERGDTIAESTPAEGIGGVATRLAFRERSDGSELNWCGLPFQGDVVDVTFPGGERVDYNDEDLEEWVTPRIRQHLATD